MAQFAHECVPQPRAALLQQFGANGQLLTRMGVATAPGAHVREQGHELDSRFSEAVDSLLLVLRITASRQQTGGRQTLQPVCEDVRGDALLALRKQLPIVTPVSEHDVTDDNQAPAVAKLFDRQVDRALGSSCLGHGHSPISGLQHTSRDSRGKPLANCKQSYQESSPWR